MKWKHSQPFQKDCTNLWNNVICFMDADLSWQNWTKPVGWINDWRFLSYLKITFYLSTPVKAFASFKQLIGLHSNCMSSCSRLTLLFQPFPIDPTLTLPDSVLTLHSSQIAFVSSVLFLWCSLRSTCIRTARGLCLTSKFLGSITVTELESFVVELRKLHA